MMSKFAKKVKGWYEAGIWDLDMVRNALEKGKITEEEFLEITGQDDE